jgi:hypothetical protein
MRSIIIAVMLLQSMTTLAATVEYSSQNIGGNTWEYSYTVTLDASEIGLGANAFIVDFNEVFPDDIYAGLSATGEPSGFSSFIQEPDHELPLPGWYAAEGLLGGTQSGFSVSFDYLAEGAPGSQSFAIMKLGPFDTLGESGQVIASGTTVSAVPIPAAVWLFGSALAGLGWLRRDRQPDLFRNRLT